MIDRYTRKEMGELWSPESRFDHLLIVEKAVAEVQGQLGIIPKEASDKILKKGKFKYSRILEIEKETKHDVIAFVSAVAENVGKEGRYLHFGLTSSDALDTALSLQTRSAWSILESSIDLLDKAFVKQIKKHKATLCAGRTHGMHAEITSFGYKLCGYLEELRRNRKRLKSAIEQMQVCKLSGAVGTYSSQSIKVEEKVAKKLKLKAETIATQVIPRDRHAELMNAIALLGAGLERISVELRHLQRTEVAEVFEGFSKGQKGSSAMPHKKNPISSENITGQARMLRSYSLVAQENIALWHERDISHSATERVSFADGFILADYCCFRMAGVIENLVVDEEQMLHNISLSQGKLYSSHVLLALVAKGISREEAYKLVQENSLSLKRSESLQNKLLEDSRINCKLSKKEIEKIFQGEAIKKQLISLVERYLRSK